MMIVDLHDGLACKEGGEGYLAPFGTPVPHCVHVDRGPENNREAETLTHMSIWITTTAKLRIDDDCLDNSFLK